MGLDGGTRITRSDVLRGQSWRLATQDHSRSTRGGSVSTQEAFVEKQLDKNSAKQIKWTTCALTGQPLQPPIVADYLGHLYNKKALWTFLLNRKGLFADDAERHFYTNIVQSHATRFQHIQKRRDVIELKIQGDSNAANERGFLCSVTGLDAMRYPFFNHHAIEGKRHVYSTPFSALAPCGHCFSDRAIEQMKDHRCMECTRPFTTIDVIHLNSEDNSKIAKMHDSLKSRFPRSTKTHSRKRKATTRQQTEYSKTVSLQKKDSSKSKAFSNELQQRL